MSRKVSGKKTAPFWAFALSVYGLVRKTLERNQDTQDLAGTSAYFHSL